MDCERGWYVKAGSSASLTIETSDPVSSNAVRFVPLRQTVWWGREGKSPLGAMDALTIAPLSQVNSLKRNGWGLSFLWRPVGLVLEVPRLPQVGV